MRKKVLFDAILDEKFLCYAKEEVLSDADSDASRRLLLTTLNACGCVNDGTTPLSIQTHDAVRKSYAQVLPKVTSGEGDIGCVLVLNGRPRSFVERPD